LIRLDDQHRPSTLFVAHLLEPVLAAPVALEVEPRLVAGGECLPGSLQLWQLDGTLEVSRERSEAHAARLGAFRDDFLGGREKGLLDLGLSPQRLGGNQLYGDAAVVFVLGVQREACA
jgi:hypothetical protein